MTRRHFGTVRKVASGKYQARYLGPDGSRHAGGTFRTKTEALQFLSETEAERSKGDWRDPRLGRLTFTDWIERYRASGAHARKRPTTRERDDSAIDTHIVPKLGYYRLGALAPIDIQSFVDDLARRRAPKTVRTIYGVASALLNAAVHADVIGRSPARGIRLPQDSATRVVRFLNVDQLRILVDSVPCEHQTMIWVAAVLGLRWSEIAGLRVGRLDPMLRTLAVEETLAEVKGELMFAPPKSRASRRTLDIPPFLAEKLAAHLARRGLTAADGDGLVFATPSGAPMRATNFRRRIWDPAIRQAGLDDPKLTFHHLRHTAVGFLIDANAPVALITQRMGHSSIRTTLDVYGHILNSTQEVATAHLESLFADGASDAIEANGSEDW